MLDLEEIRRRLQDRVSVVVAANTGLSRATIAALKNGTSPNPSRTTLRKLSDYLASPDGTP